MIQLIYGDGRIETNHGTMDGQRCLMMRDTGIERVVGTTAEGVPDPEDRENFDIILSFKNIAGARLLQDILGEMLALWSREVSPKIPLPELRP